MPNPGKFHGKRKEFLSSKRSLFAGAVEKNQMADMLLQIYRAFFKRFPLDLGDDEEPSDEALAAVDDDAADTELDVSLEDLAEEERTVAEEKIQQRRSLLEAKKGQIKRWFVYRYMRDNNFDPRSMDASNPYNTVLLGLTGVSNKQKPRLKAPVNVWCKEPDNAKSIQEEFDKIASTVDPKKRAARRAAIASSMFKALPQEQQQEWADIAQSEHEDAMAVFDELSKGKISTKPEDRQRCISGMVKLLQPILDRVAEATGFKFTLIGGGPEPADGGRINIVSMYSGVTPGPVGLNFGQAERTAYKETILPVWSRFMKACYTPEECRKRALRAPQADAQNSLQSMSLEVPGATFDSIGVPSHSSPPTDAQADTEPAIPPPAATAIAPPHAGSPRQPSALAAPSTNEPEEASEEITGIDALLAAVEIDLARGISERDHGSPIPSVVVTPAMSRAGSTSPTNPVRTPSTTASPSHTLRSLKRHFHEGSSAETFSAQKRSRQPVSVDCVVPADSPPWVSNAVEMLKSITHSSSWTELVATWLVFEGRHDFADNGKLSPKGRPKIIAEWIKNARKHTWRPKNLSNPEKMAQEHREWWLGLQPHWRKHDDGTLDRSVADGDWEGLNVNGVNGLLSALASLFFWGIALVDGGDDGGDWDEAVADCLWVIRSLSSSSSL